MSHNLQINHIQHYPIGGENALIVQYRDTGHIREVISVNGNGTVLVSEDKDNPFSYPRNKSLSEIKPLLRPLSDLYKERNGKIDIVELAKIEHPSSTYHILSNKVVEVAGDNQNSISFKYDLDENYFINSNFDCDDDYYPIMYQLDLFQYLFENHYDIFSLIEKGLAIDINTIKQ